LQLSCHCSFLLFIYLFILLYCVLFCLMLAFFFNIYIYSFNQRNGAVEHGRHFLSFWKQCHTWHNCELGVPHWKFNLQHSFVSNYMFMWPCICSCSKAVYKSVWLILSLSVQWITPDDEQRNCPKHVEFHFQNKIWEISISSWFYYKEILLAYFLVKQN
jgi:hypothetical protein